ncbi:MAG TPA: HEAT repeat domain-containing protein [Planctomycetota bacterium]|nr:HEAT repeat domain-containing protein [Planctomycetota bacterium]
MSFDVVRHALILLPLTAALSAVSAEPEEAAGDVVILDAPTQVFFRGKTQAEWAALVHNGDGPQLKPALEVLLEMASATPQLTSDLLKLIRENYAPDVARLAILVLGASAGTDVREVEPALLGILANPLEAPAKRAAACRALIELSPDSIPVRKLILAAATDRRPDVRQEAFLAMIVLAAPAPPNGFVPRKQNADDPTAKVDSGDPTAGAAKEKTARDNKNERSNDSKREKTARNNGADSKSKPTPRAESTGFPYPPAIELLAKAALSSRDAKDAAVALRALGDAGVEPLLRALAHGTLGARIEAAGALGGMNRFAHRAFPALLQAARNDTERRVRVAIARAAARLNPYDPAALDLLAENLGFGSGNAAQKKDSAEELLVDAGRAALPALRKALRANSPATRLAALKILVRFTGADTPPQSEFATEDAGVAARPLKKADVALAECLPDIAARLQDKDDAVRLLALNTLNRIGPPAADALDSIRKAIAAAPADSFARRLAAIAALNVARSPDQAVRLTPLDGRSRDELLALLAKAGAYPSPLTPLPPRERGTTSRAKRDDKDESDLAARLAAVQTNERADAAFALRLHGGDAVVADALTFALADSDPCVRRAAARSLGACGPRAAAALPTLIQWLESEPRSRAAALEAFAGLGADAKAAADALAKAAVEDEWPAHRDGAQSDSIGANSIGASAGAGNALSVTATATPTPAAQFAASLNEILGLPAIPELAYDTPSRASYAALLARALDPHAAIVVPKLCGYLRGGTPAVRVRAAETLGLLGASAAEALDALVELSQSADDAEARAAFEALRRIGPEKNPRAIRYLDGVIRGSLYAARREWAVRALGLARPGLENGAFDGTAALIAALDDPDERVCRAARRALLSIGAPILPELADAVLKSDAPRTNWALFTLAEFKADATNVVPRLANVICSAEDPLQRAVAADLLLNYSPAQSSASTALLKLLCAREDIAAHAAMRALKPIAREVRPAIERLLLDRDPAVRVRAAEGLDSIQN